MCLDERKVETDTLHGKPLSDYSTRELETHLVPLTDEMIAVWFPGRKEMLENEIKRRKAAPGHTDRESRVWVERSGFV
jgi:hypothetical protein